MTEEEQTEILCKVLDRVDEVGECLIWNKSVNGGGFPIIRINDVAFSVRRLVYKLVNGPIQNRPVEATCGDKRCVNPDHLVASSLTSLMKKAWARGAWRSIARNAKVAASKRAIGKLTMDQANEIRFSDKSASQLARDFGINPRQVRRIRAGEAWKDYSNPWAGLL